MPLNHDEAAATITVTGVSLGCVNADAGHWEVGFIRHPAHVLVMSVTRLTNGREEPFEQQKEIPRGCRITIRVVGAAGVAETPTQVFEPGDADPEDFGHIVDIEKDVYRGVNIPFKHPEHEVTPLIVPGARLFSVADRRNDFPVRLIRKGALNSAAVDRFGFIGTTAGADIGQAGDDYVVIAVEGDGGFELPLPRAAGTSYRIAFDNTCPGDANSPRPARRDGAFKTSLTGEPVGEHSDFVLYYTVLDPGERGLFDLVSDEPGRGDGAVCNYSHLGLKTRMFPLP